MFEKVLLIGVGVVWLVPVVVMFIKTVWGAKS